MIGSVLFVICSLLFFFLGIALGYYIHPGKDYFLHKTIYFDYNRLGPSTVKIYAYTSNGDESLTSHFEINDIASTRMIALLGAMMSEHQAELLVEGTGIGYQIYERLKLEFGYKRVKLFLRQGI